MASPDPFQPLKDALAVSPTNVPLRLHLADALVAAAKADEAEGLLKDGLTRTPGEPQLKLALAKVYLSLGKFSAGVVVCEDILRGKGAPPEAKVLLAKLLHQDGETGRAVTMYKSALDDDPDLAASALARFVSRSASHPICTRAMVKASGSVRGAGGIGVASTAVGNLVRS